VRRRRPAHGEIIADASHHHRHRHRILGSRRHHSNFTITDEDADFGM